MGARKIMSKIKEAKNNAAGKGKSEQGKTIALNRMARHDYHLESRVEAGIALQGWELKSIRAGRMNMGDAYATIRNGEIFLFGAQITPLIQASSHVVTDDRRTRKLLLHRHEIDKLVGKVEREGYTLIPTACYWSKNKVKLELALAKGKQAHDKRASEKDRDWAREKQRTMRQHNRNA
jgi:SsrA-binding protein